MLCAFGLVLCAATAAQRARDLAALAAGFVIATVVASPQRLPDPAWVGVVTAGAAIVILFRPRYAMASAAWGGALGGMLTAMTEVQGLHPMAATAAVAVLAGVLRTAQQHRAHIDIGIRDLDNPPHDCSSVIQNFRRMIRQCVADRDAARRRPKRRAHEVGQAVDAAL